jgi:hypothetical protein
MVVDDRDAWARLIPGDAILFGVGDGRVMVRVGDERERELVKLDGTLANVISLGHMKFAAKSNAGEIVRGDLASSKIERTRVPPTRGALGVDPQGRVLLTDNKRLLVWDTSVREIAAFDRAIVDLAPVEGGIGVTLEGGEARVVDLRNGGVAVHRVLAPGRYMPQYSSNGKLIANLDSVNRTQLIDMPSRAHWSLPTLRDANQVLGVSPNGRRILQSSSFLHGVWQLPEVPSDPSEFPGWLTEQTNATVDKDGSLVWPGQRTP